MKGQLFLPCDSTRLWWFEEIMSLDRNYIGFQTILWTCRNKNRMTTGNSVKGLNINEPFKKKKKKAQKEKWAWGHRNFSSEFVMGNSEGGAMRDIGEFSSSAPKGSLL